MLIHSGISPFADFFQCTGFRTLSMCPDTRVMQNLGIGLLKARIGPGRLRITQDSISCNPCTDNDIFNGVAVNIPGAAQGPE